MTDVSSSNYFELFDIPVSYGIDMDAVQRKYRDLQKAVHPDKYASSGSRERRMSMQQTSLINQAYNTLKHPVDRAVYLLSLKGIDVNMEKETTMDHGFLVEQMELREQMADAKTADDPLAELDRLAEAIRDRNEELMEAFNHAFQESEYITARDIVRKLQFLNKSRTEVENITARIEDEIL